jgi:hypothetical protein
MDTTTVLEIIKRLENRCNKASNEWRAERLENILQGKEPDADRAQYLRGVADGIQLTIDHLQSFIEAELNKAEQ